MDRAQEIEQLRSAVALLAREDWKAAWPILLSIAQTAEDPEIITAALNNLGQLCEKMENAEGDARAIECYREAIRFSGHPMALCNFGHKIKDDGQWDNAFAALEKAVELAPENALIRFRFSLLSLTLGDFERGWTDYEARLNLMRPSQSTECPGSSPK